MGLSFYAPTKSNTGGLVTVAFNSKDKAVYLNFVKQNGWEGKNGVFKGGAKINVKLSVEEVGGIIRAIRTNKEFSFYHSFDGGATTGRGGYYKKESTEEGGKAKEGFGFSVKAKDVEIRMSLTLGGAESMMEYLRFALEHIYSSIYSEDKKAFEDRAKAKHANKAVLPPKQKEEPVEEQSVEEEVLSDDDIF